MRLNVFTVIVLSFYFISANAQLGFCTGNKGTPIFNENFGNKKEKANKRDIGETSYIYVKNITPGDGYYAISNIFNWYSSWHDTNDHTPNDEKGKALIINADRNNAGLFFSRKINGLCPGSTYEFSAWLLNLTSAIHNNRCHNITGILGGIPIDVRFEVWDETNSKILKSGTTGKIFGNSKPLWKKYGLVFQTVKEQENVILKIFNNGKGGCGNDLAIDDIEFAACGDLTTITSNISNESHVNICHDFNDKIQLNAVTDFNIFQTSFYKWQYSKNGINYTDIPNQTTNTYVLDSLPPNQNNYYRVKVAENLQALNNPLCNITSKPYIIKNRSTPVLPNTITKEFCENEEINVSFNVTNNQTKFKWFDNSGKLIDTSSTFKPKNLKTGTTIFFLEVYNKYCNLKKRTKLKINKVAIITLVEDHVALEICEGDETTLDSGIDSSFYKWSTGETSKEITIDKKGVYTLTLSNSKKDICSKTITYTITNPLPYPIDRIERNRDQLIVKTLSKKENFEYSIDGVKFQKSNIFSNVKNGVYLFHLREIGKCGTSKSTMRYVKL